ncbi:MAG: hypothetical protein APR54_09365 [Candidatus Cloacimonas sp. SDB]|nr:MAG: hypothetical protein APR54_09365 [Candidatus Cloacimonas sp. SDB]
MLLILVFNSVYSQENTGYKTRVLETVEIEILTSFYTQDGNNAAVTGGIGTEELTDAATYINISIPINEDDILSIDGTVSAYSSASSSNLNPFTSASTSDTVTGSPWVESSGASRKDVWTNANVAYSHSSDDRNNITGINISYANEYDYSSLGFGGNFAQLFNNKNTEIGIRANVFLDNWRPVYPTEIISYLNEGGDLNEGFFADVDILNSNGEEVDYTGPDIWSPVSNTLVEDNTRNTYSFSVIFSQILTPDTQVSLFSDLVIQTGWLSNPMQRVYFSDRDNYFIGNPASIPYYTSQDNTNVFQLADDIERLPDSRIKTPVGLRLNYYINEYFVLRNYYRYYFDDWDIKSHTAEMEIPIKISDKFTLYPSYRYYTQTASKYFAPYEKHLSAEEFYTSDYDLSEFSASQFGFGIKYIDILTGLLIWKFGLKSVSLDYSYYNRDTGLKSHIVTFGLKFLVF